jgi:hypothetical protein
MNKELMLSIATFLSALGGLLSILGIIWPRAILCITNNKLYNSLKEKGISSEYKRLLNQIRITCLGSMIIFAIICSQLEGQVDDALSRIYASKANAVSPGKVTVQVNPPKIPQNK